MDIYLSYQICVNSFGALFEAVESPRAKKELASQLSLSTLRDELGRLRVWAENTGAHRSGRMSLDHRLREASKIKEEVLDLLGELKDCIQNAIAILSGNKTPYDEESSPSSSAIMDDEDDEDDLLEDDHLLEGESPLGDLSSTTELEEASIEIKHIITCLYKLSIAIRNPAPRDRLQKCGSINVSHFEFFDIQHVSNKYAFLAQSGDAYLVERLGRANTRRRQLLEYHKRHHQKIARHADQKTGHESEYNDRIKVQNTNKSVNQIIDKTPSIPEKNENIYRNLEPVAAPTSVYTTNTHTTVSTFVMPVWDLKADYDNTSDTGVSQTSYATSLGGDQGSRIRVPPPPNQQRSLDGEPFECPYCFCIKKVKNTQAWMRHVFRDLRPYVCTFKHCSKPDQLFETRHDWFEHEMGVHRREWFCNICQKVFVSGFKQHLSNRHSDIISPDQLDSMVDGCERAMVSEQKVTCPLCGRKDMSLMRLRSHLARHFQQIALFMLPYVPKEKEEKGEAGSVGAQASKVSSDESSKKLLDSDMEELVFSSQASQDVSEDAETIPEIQEKLQPDPDPEIPSTDDRLAPEIKGSFKDALDSQDLAMITVFLDGGENIEKIINKLTPLTPLLYSCEKGLLSVVRLLLDRGANIKATQENRWTPLHLAAFNGHLEISQLLLDRGANIEATQEDRWTPLHCVAYNGHLEIAQLLLDRGANIEATQEDRWTPLHCAAYNSHLEIVQLLLDRGANIEATQEDRWTPLHFAAYNSHLEIAQLLLDRGANIKATTRDESTPLHISTQKNNSYISSQDNDKIIDLLRKRGSNIML